MTYFDDTCDFRYNACFTKCEEKRTCYFYGGFYKNRSGSNLIGNSLDRFCWNWSYEELKDIKLYNGEKIEDIIQRQVFDKEEYKEEVESEQTKDSTSK